MVHCLSVLAALIAADAPEGPPRPADIEPAVLTALRGGKPEALAAVAADIAALTPAARRDLPVRVRGDAVEFRFRGTFPGKDFSPEMLEYVIGTKEKNYETLLVVTDDELARLTRIGAGLGGPRPLRAEVKFAWTEGGEARVEDLRDIVALEAPKKRDEFLNGLVIGRFGLLQENVRSDPARLPAKAQPAVVLLTVRVAWAGK